MNTEHIKSHSPNVTMDQLYMLVALSKEKLSEKYDEYLYSIGEPKGVPVARTVRYRDGYINPSKGYETGPCQTFKDMVETL